MALLIMFSIIVYAGDDNYNASFSISLCLLLLPLRLPVRPASHLQLFHIFSLFSKYIPPAVPFLGDSLTLILVYQTLLI